MTSGRSDGSRTLQGKLAAGWVWWGLLAACVAIGGLGVFWALYVGDHGKGRNRGPADEAAPSARPSQDIDRSRSR